MGLADQDLQLILDNFKEPHNFKFARVLHNEVVRAFECAANPNIYNHNSCVELLAACLVDAFYENRYRFIFQLSLEWMKTLFRDYCLINDPSSLAAIVIFLGTINREGCPVLEGLVVRFIERLEEITRANKVDQSSAKSALASLQASLSQMSSISQDTLTRIARLNLTINNLEKGI